MVKKVETLKESETIKTVLKHEGDDSEPQMPTVIKKVSNEEGPRHPVHKAEEIHNQNIPEHFPS